MSLFVRARLRKSFPFFFIKIFAGKEMLFVVRLSHASVQLTSATVNDRLLLFGGVVGLLQLWVEKKKAKIKVEVK